MVDRSPSNSTRGVPVAVPELSAASPVFDAYLGRLGIEREPPSAAALRRIHRAHVERIAYETLWIHLREGWTVDPVDALHRIALGQRGGYCFHLNSALHALLSHLGYASTRHVATVHGPQGPAAEPFPNHLALTVANVPNDDGHGTTDWYVDAGLGDAMHEPIPLVAGEYVQGPMHLALLDCGDSTWQLSHDQTLGSFTAMTFTCAATDMSAFVDPHHQLSTSPTSRFVRTVTVQRRDAHGVDVLRGCMLTRVGDASSPTELDTADAWFGVLAETFDLPLTEVTEEHKQELWTKVADAHRRWLETRRS